MRVIVTGASGYLGGHVVERLAADGHAVTALVREPSRASAWLRERADVRVGDLAASIDAEPLRGHDACVHLALLWPVASAQPEIDDVTASARWFETLGRAGVGRVVYVSSAAVHRPFGPRMREDDRLRGADGYGAAKIAGEALLQASAATHGFSASVVRPGPSIGLSAEPGCAPKTPHAIAALHSALRAGRGVQVSAREGRQLTSCVDLAACIAAVIAAPQAPELLLCMSRQITTWAEIAQALAERIERPGPIELIAREGGEPIASFDVMRVEGFLGRILSPHDALAAHLDWLATQPPGET